MGKGKRKRNKELRALSKVFQGQPFSPLWGTLFSPKSPPGQLNLFPLSCGTEPFPCTPTVLSHSTWHRGASTAGMPAAMPASPATAACTGLDLHQNSGAVQAGFPMGKVHRRHTAREHRQEASCSVCRRKVWMRAGTNEIWRSKHCCIASRNLALISSSNACWIIHVHLSSASLLTLLVIPLGLPSRVCFIIVTLSKAQGELVSALWLGEKAVAKAARQEQAGKWTTACGLADHAAW